MTSDRFVSLNADQIPMKSHLNPKVDSSLSSTLSKPDLLSLTFESLKELLQHLGIRF